jgi:hypothetical protein
MIEVRNWRIAEVFPNHGFANKRAAHATGPLPHVRFGEYVSFRVAEARAAAMDKPVVVARFFRAEKALVTCICKEVSSVGKL